MKIVILDAFSANPGDLSWEGIRAYGELTTYERTPRELIAARITDNEIVFTNKTPISREVLAQCPCVRMICLLATGYNIVDTQAAAERGIPVCNIPAYSTAAVAQMAMAHLLEICNHVGEYSKACHDGTWTRSQDFCYQNIALVELAGKTLGLIGYGKIGQAFGKIAQAMGMKLLVTTPQPKTDCEWVPLEELLARADVISLHCPLTEQTKQIINRDTIARMKNGVILLNTRRGGLVNEQDLADALRTGKVRAAGVDVVSAEPIEATNPLLDAPNCYMTPHIAWASYEARARLLAIAEENLRAFLQARPINVVNGR